MEDEGENTEVEGDDEQDMEVIIWTGGEGLTGVFSKKLKTKKEQEIENSLDRG